MARTSGACVALAVAIIRQAEKAGPLSEEGVAKALATLRDEYSEASALDPVRVCHQPLRPLFAVTSSMKRGSGCPFAVLASAALGLDSFAAAVDYEALKKLQRSLSQQPTASPRHVAFSVTGMSSNAARLGEAFVRACETAVRTADAPSPAPLCSMLITVRCGYIKVCHVRACKCISRSLQALGAAEHHLLAQAHSQWDSLGAHADECILGLRVGLLCCISDAAGRTVQSILATRHGASEHVLPVASASVCPAPTVTEGHLSALALASRVQHACILLEALRGLLEYAFAKWPVHVVCNPYKPTTCARKSHDQTSAAVNASLEACALRQMRHFENLAVSICASDVGLPCILRSLSTASYGCRPSWWSIVLTKAEAPRAVLVRIIQRCKHADSAKLPATGKRSRSPGI